MTEVQIYEWFTALNIKTVNQIRYEFQKMLRDELLKYKLQSWELSIKRSGETKEKCRGSLENRGSMV